MRKPSPIKLHSLNRKRRPVSRSAKDAIFKYIPNDLASLIRGLYRRVAGQLRVHPSYVSRVARRERRSKLIENALRRELGKILKNIGEQNAGIGGKAARKIGHQKRSKKSK